MGNAAGEVRLAAPSGKWTAITILSVAGVLALAPWFSMSAVIPVLRREYGLDDFQVSLLTSSVSIGFVAGTLTSAILGLADRLDPQRFFMASAFVAAAANGAVLTLDPASPWVVVLRFVTGACVAGLYPVGMRMVATWARGENGAKGDTGLLVGVLVGAVTLGSGTPHLFKGLGGADWRLTIVLASLSVLAAGLMINLVRLGPAMARASRFNPADALQAWTNKPLRLANLGYFGHMWELYAMWGWIGVFLHASFIQRWGAGAADRAALYASLLTFAVIGVGALGCLFGGVFADRMGRTTLTMGAMALSGGCALVVGFFFGGDPWLLAALCLVWGVTVVADSAQFSSSIIELSPADRVGTMLTMQTCVGFLLTLLTIHLIPRLVEAVGWRYAFAPLAIGPFLGVWAMARLRAHPESRRLAGGRR